MPTEQQLLNTIFADGAAPNERETAIAVLKKLTGKDRAGLVEQYTKGAANSSDDDDVERYSEMWRSEMRRRVAIERELATERKKRQSADELMMSLNKALNERDEKIRQLEEARGEIDPHIPGFEEPIAPAHFKMDRKTRSIKPIEAVCAAYGLVLSPTSALPDIPLGYPYWRPKRGKVFTSACPICQETLWVNTHYQRWTDLRCDFRFSLRKKHAPDALGLVEHLTGCSYYNALWWCIGTGTQPQRKDSTTLQPGKTKARRGKKKEAA
jgi:hypothetical protein